MLTWQNVEWLRSLTSLPLVLKAILDPDDAAQAVETGANGIVVSNHGALPPRVGAGRSTSPEAGWQRDPRSQPVRPYRCLCDSRRYALR